MEKFVNHPHISIKEKNLQDLDLKRNIIKSTQTK